MHVNSVAADPELSLVLSYGLGADSTCVLLRWLREPQTCPVPLERVVVLTAMTGNEWESTSENVRAHVLPELRAHGVRFIQVARAGRHVRKDGTGVSVLDDSREPYVLYSAGDFTLEDEMLSAGTLPQLGGSRICSAHAKGSPLDAVIERLFAGRSYRHAMGFEANEQRRADKDALYNTERRTGVYPLIEWGFTRQDALDYIASVTGVTAWPKSACTYCPFALGSRDGREATLVRYEQHPDVAARALLMETVAVALNPAQGLMANRRLVDELASAGASAAIAAHTELLNSAEYAVYRVRRIYRAHQGDPTRKSPRTDRSVRRIASGPRADMEALVRSYRELGCELDVSDPAAERAYRRRRGDRYPTVEEFVVAAPAVVDDKQLPRFEQWWTEHTGEPELLQLL